MNIENNNIMNDRELTDNQFEETSNQTNIPIESIVSLAQYLISFLEKKLSASGRLPETDLYYLLRDEGYQIYILLSEFIEKIHATKHNVPELLNLSTAVLHFFERLVEIGQQYYAGQYTAPAEKAALLNLRTLQKMGKTDLVIAHLKQLPWSTMPVNTKDNETRQEIKKLAATLNAQKHASSYTYQPSSLTQLIKSGLSYFSHSFSQLAENMVTVTDDLDRMEKNEHITALSK